VCFWRVVGRATAPQLPALSPSWWLPRATFSLSVGDGGCRIGGGDSDDDDDGCVGGSDDVGVAAWW